MGTRFWLGFIGILLLIGLGLMIGLLIFGAALETWGFFGALLALCGVLIGVGWVMDRRRPPRPDRI